jgi:hypothetical protein
MSDTPSEFEIIATDVICQRVYAMIQLCKALDECNDEASSALLFNMGVKLYNSLTIQTPEVPEFPDNVIPFKRKD